MAMMEMSVPMRTQYALAPWHAGCGDARRALREGENVIGRCGEWGIKDPRVSRRHAVVRVDDGRVRVAALTGRVVYVQRSGSGRTTGTASRRGWVRVAAATTRTAAGFDAAAVTPSSAGDMEEAAVPVYPGDVIYCTLGGDGLVLLPSRRQQATAMLASPPGSQQRVTAAHTPGGSIGILTPGLAIPRKRALEGSDSDGDAGIRRGRRARVDVPDDGAPMLSQLLFGDPDDDSAPGVGGRGGSGGLGAGVRVAALAPSQRPASELNSILAQLESELAAQTDSQALCADAALMHTPEPAVIQITSASTRRNILRPSRSDVEGGAGMPAPPSERVLFPAGMELESQRVCYDHW